MTDSPSDPLQQKLDALPAQPGCYLFKDKADKVLYVGKAKSLRARVRSYFQSGSSDDRAFLPLLLRRVTDLETVVTGTEKEAAILENNLIKEQKPLFNVKLRDDKEYLTLRLDTHADWPRLELVRRPETDQANYFGPYHSATAARRTLHLVEKHFKLRTCSDRELATRRRPCLQYQIKRCDAPCVYDVDREAYAGQVQSVSLFLAGRHDELSQNLGHRMKEASRELHFELAATYRDQLAAVKSVQQRQRVVSVSDRDQDVVGLYREGDLVEFALLYVRSGRVVETASFSNPRVEAPDDEVVATYLRERYADASALIPDEIILPVLPEGAAGVEEWLSEQRQEQAKLIGSAKPRKVRLFAPARGERKKLLDLAQENARHAFAEKQRAKEAIDERLAKLQTKLRLPSLPRRIETADISHLGGQDTYGAVVALVDGAPHQASYKLYKVKSDTEGDDYEAMYEVLRRRFARGRAARQRDEAVAAGTHAAGNDAAGSSVRPDDDDPGEVDRVEREDDAWQLPDLFVVDGGRGQLGVALTAARDLGLHDLCLAGLAKERETPLGEKLVDRIYLPGQKNPIALRPASPELFLLALGRDEAHRFANRGRARAGKKRRLTSTLDAVPGIGPKTRVALLKALGSLDAVKRASADELLAVPGVTRRHVAALRGYFAPEPDDSEAQGPDPPLSDNGAG